MGFVKINSSSSVCLSLRVSVFSAFLATGFERVMCCLLKKDENLVKVRDLINP
jgi:hypothetical protein